MKKLNVGDIFTGYILFFENYFDAGNILNQ